MDFLTARQCTGNSYVVYPVQMYDLPLAECGTLLSRAGYGVTGLEFMINATGADRIFTLYRTGRLLISPCSDKETALQCAAEFFGVIEKDSRLSKLLEQEGQRV